MFKEGINYIRHLNSNKFFYWNDDVNTQYRFKIY